MAIQDLQNSLEVLRQTVAQKDLQPQTQAEPLESTRSALSSVGRWMYGFADDFGKREILRNEGYKESQIVPLRNGEYGVKMEVNGIPVIRPVDPKGFKFNDIIGDIAESGGKAITTSGGILGAIAGGTTGAGGVVGAGLGASLGELGRQRIGESIGVRNPENFGQFTYQDPLGRSHIGGVTEVALEGLINAGGEYAGQKIGKFFADRSLKKQIDRVAMETDYLDPVTGLKLPGVTGKGASAGEKMATWSGNKGSDDIYDWVIKKVNSGHADDFDWNPATGANRLNERMGAIAEQKVLPAFKHLDDIRSKNFASAWKNLPDEIKNTYVSTKQIEKTITEILDQNGLLKTVGKGRSLRQVFDDKAFGASQFKDLASLLEEVSKPKSGVELNALKQRLGKIINWDALDGFHPNSAPTPFDKLGAKIYGTMANTINDTLGMAPANAEFANMSRILDNARRFVRPQRIQTMLERLAKDPAKKAFMMGSLTNLDQALPPQMRFMDSLLNAQGSALLSDLGFSGSVAGSPKTVIQKYLTNPGMLLRGWRLANTLGKKTEFLAGPMGKALTKLLSTPQGKMAVNQALLTTGTRSLNSILYKNQ